MWSPVRDEIHPEASAAALAENPAEEEVAANGPLRGRSGTQGWNPALAAIGRKRKELTIVNIWACKPPGDASGAFKRTLIRLKAVNDERALQGLDPLPSPTTACKPRVDAIMGRYNHQIALGGSAAEVLTGDGSGILSIRGDVREFPLPGGGKRTVALTVHPSFVLRAPHYEEHFQADLGKAFRWFEGRRNWIEPIYEWRPTPARLREWLAQPARFTVHDYETTLEGALRARVYCLGLARLIEPAEVRTCEKCGGTGRRVLAFHREDGWSPAPIEEQGLACECCKGEGRRKVTVHAVLVPFMSCEDGVSRFYSAEDEAEIRRVLQAHMVNPTHWKVGHNLLGFDTFIDERFLNAQTWPVLDTLPLARHRNPAAKKGLKVVGGLLTDAHAWGATTEGERIAEAPKSDKQLGYYCLHAETMVRTERGPMRISDIVIERRDVRVATWNNQTGRKEYARILEYHKSKAPRAWYKVTTKAKHGRAVVTSDHLWLTPEGWVQAQHLQAGQKVAYDEPALSRQQLQAIVGSVLGDGQLTVSPTKRKRPLDANSAAFFVSHAKKSGLTQFKHEALGGTVFVNPPYEIPGSVKTINGRTGIAGPASVACSRSFVQLAQIMPMVYDSSGKRRVTRQALDFMGAPGLAWWIMDDGCIQRYRGCSGLVLSSQGFPREDVELAAQWFRDKYGHHSRPNRRGKLGVSVGKDNVIRLSPRLARAVARDAAPYVAPQARYKLPQEQDYPPYTPLSMDTQGTTVWVDVVQSVPWVPAHASSRWCISVDHPTRAFFTNAGLVHNCGMDVAVNAIIYDRLYADAEARGYFRPLRPELKPAGWPTQYPWNLFGLDQYRQSMCRHMTRSGYFIDQDRREKHERELIAEARKYRAIAQRYAHKLGITGKVLLDKKTGEARRIDLFNPGSNVQILRVLVDSWGIPLTKRSEKTGNLSADDEVLREVITMPDLDPDRREFLDAVRRFKRALKALGTFVRPLQRIDQWTPTLTKKGKPKGKPPLCWEDGRVRSSWSEMLTSVARLSSKGPNLQNVPPRFRDMFCAPPGFVLLGGDVDQFHLRIIANRWRIGRLLEAFQDGIDPHSSLALDFFGSTFVNAPGWGPDGFSLKRKPEKGSVADGMRHLAKVLRYRGAYADNEEGLLQTVRKVEDPDTGEMPFAHMTLREVKRLYRIWMRAEPEWEHAWAWVQEQYDRNGGWIEEAVFGRRSGDLEGGKKQAVVNYDILAKEPELFAIIENNIRTEFPDDFEGPGTGLIHQGHDAANVCARGKAWIVVQGKKKVVVCDEATEDRRRRMEAAMTLDLSKTLGWPVPITAEVKVGPNIDEHGNVILSNWKAA
jgi:uracil-DNA glycosylase family 4